MASTLDEMRKRKNVATALVNTDRSVRDFALAACCIEYDLTNPTATGREDILRGRDASGNSITNERLHRTGAVLVYNAEDRLSEMQRRLWSGVDMPAFKIMNRPDARSPLKRAEGADLLEAAILRYDVKLVIADPLVALADGALENDNNDMNAVLQAFADISAKLDIGMMLLHHTGKGRDKAGDESAARGASAIIGARANCRLGRSPATRFRCPGCGGRVEMRWPLAADLFLR